MINQRRFTCYDRPKLASLKILIQVMFLSMKSKYSMITKRGDVMFGLGMGELVVIVLILMLFFGPKKLPQLGKGIGEAIREFKKAGTELKSDSDKDQRNS